MHRQPIEFAAALEWEEYSTPEKEARHLDPATHSQHKPNLKQAILLP